MEINALSPLLCLPTEIYISDAFFSVYYTVALEEGIEIALAFERKEGYLEHKKFVVLHINMYHRSLES